MPGSTTIARGNIILAATYALTISPVSVAANNTAEQTFTLPGLLVGDGVFVSKPTFQAGLAVSSARVSAANTIAITFINCTASPIVPTAAELYTVKVNRPESTTFPLAIV